MFFTQAMSSIFATHPPISDRIFRIEGSPISTVAGKPTSEASAAGVPAVAMGFAGGDDQATL